MAHSNNPVITGRFKESPAKELVLRDREGKTVVAKARKRRRGVSVLNRIEQPDKQVGKVFGFES